MDDLDVAALDLASTVVVGGVDALTSSDVALLEQFVRVRGGTLVLLPERAPAGPWTRLLSGSWTEHLSDKPETVGALHASEVLHADRLPITATVIARAGSSASIVVLPIGGGRVVVSGAMDAWRYRDLDAGGFDQFWRSLIAESAASGGPSAGVRGSALSAGTRARFTLRDRRMEPAASTEASATAHCGSGPATVIRMWPAGSQGDSWVSCRSRATGLAPSKRRSTIARPRFDCRCRDAGLRRRANAGEARTSCDRIRWHCFRRG